MENSDSNIKKINPLEVESNPLEELQKKAPVEPKPAPIEPQEELATLWHRVAAGIIDGFAFFTLCALFMAVMLGLGLGQVLYYDIIYLPLFLLYCTLTEGSWYKATFGKQFLNLWVEKLDGKHLSRKEALIRTTLKVVSLIPFGVGFLLAINNPRNQTFYDQKANTLVKREVGTPFWGRFLAGIAFFSVLAIGLALYFIFSHELG